MNRELIIRAIQMFKSERGLAAAIGVSQVAVHKMKQKGRVSAESAVKIHEATRGEVPKWELRPDLWDEPSETHH